MNNSTLGRSPRRARGFTLVELMVALLIGLFLTGGLLTMVFAMRRTTAIQSGLSQLQDDQRMGMSILTDAVQSAGYYPNPYLNSASTLFPQTTVAPVFAAGQSITGVHTSAATPDTLTVRYTTAGSATALVKDNTVNCAGQTSSTQITWTNTFQIDTVNKVLQCSLFNGTTTTVLNLVTGVQNMQVLYGVQSSAATPTNSADCYMTADAITTASLWPKVVSVKVTLTYANPMANQPGQTATTIAFTRVITVMNNTGVDT